MSPSRSRFDVIGQLGSLRRYARSLTRNPVDAEDLVHDALVRAYERKHLFRQDGNLRAWLLSILHNAFIDKTRSRRAEQGREEETRHLTGPSVEPAQEHMVRLGQVRNAFLTLPDEQRAVLHLVAIEGLSYQEAADALSIPLGTLMSRLGRARAALRQIEGSTPNTATPGHHLRLVGGRDDSNA